jgi:hypothetical protein
MLTLCKSTVLSAAFLAGIAIAANADPASGASGSQSQGRGLAALPPSTATPVPNSVTQPQTKNYQVPSDFDANVNLHPYTPPVSKGLTLAAMTGTTAAQRVVAANPKLPRVIIAAR